MNDLSKLRQRTDEIMEQKRGTPITWIHVVKELPDDDLTVMIALKDGEVYMGFLDGETWRYMDGTEPSSPVIAWAHVPAHPWDAA